MDRGASLENTGYLEKPSMRSTYVGIPVSIVAHTANYKKEGRFGLFVEGGLAYLINAGNRNSYWIDQTYSILDFIAEAGFEMEVNPGIIVGGRYKYMNDLGHAYTVKHQYFDDTNSYNLFHHTEYYYSTNSYSLSVRVRLK